MNGADTSSKTSRAVIFILLPITVILLSWMHAGSWPDSRGHLFEGLLTTVAISAVVGVISYGVRIPFIAHTMLVGQIVFLPHLPPALKGGDIGTAMLLAIGPFIALGVGVGISLLWWFLIRSQALRDKTGLIKKWLVRLTILFFGIWVILAGLYVADASSCGTNLGMRNLIGEDDFYCLSEKAIEENDWRLCLVDSDYIRDRCLYQTMLQIPDPAICEQSFDDKYGEAARTRDACYSHISRKLQDVALCGQIRDESSRHGCVQYR